MDVILRRGPATPASTPVTAAPWGSDRGRHVAWARQRRGWRFLTGWRRWGRGRRRWL